MRAGTDGRERAGPDLADMNPRAHLALWHERGDRWRPERLAMLLSDTTRSASQRLFRQAGV